MRQENSCRGSTDVLLPKGEKRMKRKKDNILMHKFKK
jgi:hypothetical protein